MKSLAVTVLKSEPESRMDLRDTGSACLGFNDGSLSESSHHDSEPFTRKSESRRRLLAHWQAEQVPPGRPNPESESWQPEARIMRLVLNGVNRHGPRRSRPGASQSHGDHDRDRASAAAARPGR